MLIVLVEYNFQNYGVTLRIMKTIMPHEQEQTDDESAYPQP
jgi:hypothetical protein